MKPNGVVIAALACAIGLTQAGWGQPMGPTTITPKRFVADAANRVMKVYPGSGLTAPFTRNLVTIDPDGTQADANKLRVDRLVHIAAIPSAYDQPPPTLETGGALLASGVDHTGSSELLLYLAAQGHRFDIYENGVFLRDWPLGKPKMGPLSLQARGLDPMSDVLFLDVLNLPWQTGAKVIEPASVVIFHGAIIVAGAVWIGTTQTNKYELMGWGFAMSLDKGQSWTLEWDNTTQAQAQLYSGRGKAWCLRAAPIYQRNQSNPTSCSICCTDYVHRHTNPALDAVSGRVFYARISRPTGQSSNWGFGANTTYKVKVFDFTPLGAPAPVKPLSHTHSCMATEWSQSGSQGVQLLVSIGDGRARNRFIRITSADYGGDYTTAPWVIQDDYHGKADPAGQFNTISTESPQPVGAVFGANAGEVIWGTDIRQEWLFMTKLPTSSTATPDQARFEHLYGLATGFGKNGPDRSWPAVFDINQPRPELPTGPLTGVYVEETHAGAEPDANRVLYCPDTSKPREWVQVAAWRPISSLDPVTVQCAAVHSGQIYFGGQNHGLKRRPIPVPTPVATPTLRAIRPVLVGPGGKNLVKGGTGCYFNDEAPEPPTTLMQLTQVTAIPPVWRDDQATPPLTLPAVPSLGNRALRIRTTRADSNGYFARARVSSDVGTSWNTLSSGGWVTGPTAQVRRFRGWVLDGSHNQAAQIAPNKTNQVYLRLWDEDPSPPLPAGAMSEYSCHDRWIPCTNISARTLAPLTGLGLRLNALTSGLDTDKEDNRGYLVVGEALDGNGSLPYPMAPEADGPDEVLTIKDFSIGTSQSWWVKVAGMMPIANWDHHAARLTTVDPIVSDRRWPLFTLWAATDRYVEFLADCENKGFMVRYRTGPGSQVVSVPFGDQKQIWLPDSPLLAAISFDLATNKIYVGASLGGDLVQVLPDGITWPTGTAITELRFRGATGGYSSKGEVCEFRWIGGEINPGGVLNEGVPSGVGS